MKIALNKSTNAHQMALYNEEKEQAGTAVKIGGNILGKDSKEVIHKLHQVAFQHNHGLLKNRFVHMKVAVSPQDDNLSNRTFRKIGERVMEGMGYKNTPYLVYRHNDTNHPHIHIVLSRITFEGKVISDKLDGLLARKLEGEIEKEFELTRNKDRLLSEGGIRKPGYTERYRMGEEMALRKDLSKKGLTTDEIDRKIKTYERKENTHRRYVINSFMESISDRPTPRVFLARMERRGIEVWRHEFQKGDKKMYGLTYKVNPDLMKASFASTDFVGEFSGMKVNDSFLKDRKIPHPIYGPVEGNYQIGRLGRPELCLFNTEPVQSFIPMSFRASNLGPLMMHDSVLKSLSIANNSSFDTITVKRGKSIPKVNYQREPLTLREPVIVSSILVGAESRSKERVREVLLSGFKIEELNKFKGTYSADDYQFILNEKKSLDKKLVGELITGTVKPRTLLEEYMHISGQRPNEPTKQILDLLTAQQWGGVELKLKEIMETRPDLVPDPGLSRLSIMPRALQVPFFDYYAWLEREREQISVDENARKARIEREAVSRNLLISIQAGDYHKVDEILKDSTLAIRSIPRQILNEVKNEDLKERLLKRYALTLESERNKVLAQNISKGLSLTG